MKTTNVLALKYLSQNIQTIYAQVYEPTKLNICVLLEHHPKLIGSLMYRTHSQDKMDPNPLKHFSFPGLPMNPEQILLSFLMYWIPII